MFPPCSAQHSSARFIHASSGWSADSNASTSTASSPLPAPELKASPSSRTRQFAGYSPACEIWRVASAALIMLGNGHRRARAKRRPILKPHPGLGDDAENSFGTDEHPVRAGTRARAGQAARFDHSGWSDDAEGFDEVVDMRVQRREMPARPRRDPSAQRREFE